MAGGDVLPSAHMFSCKFSAKELVTVTNLGRSIALRDYKGHVTRCGLPS